jgi:putative spermidine/putrescine transport system permease protein
VTSDSAGERADRAPSLDEDPRRSPRATAPSGAVPAPGVPIPAIDAVRGVGGPARGGALNAVAGFLLAMLLLLPFVPLLFWSVSARWFFPNLLPTELSPRAWLYLASPVSQVAEAMVTSLSIATTVAIIAAAIGLLSGRALGLHGFRGKRVVEFLILAPVIVPPLTVTMGVHILFIRYGLADTIPGVVLVHLIPTIPYVTLVMASVYANYDVTFEEQARVLGANLVRVFWHVTLPAVFPGLVVAALFAFLISWSEYIMTLLIGGGQVVTLPLLLFSFTRNDASVAGALSLVFIAPAVALLLFSSKYLSGSRAAIGGFGRL